MLICKLEISTAERAWSRQESPRRAEILETRWEEVRDVEMVDDQLRRRLTVADMQTYAHVIDRRAEQLNDSDAGEPESGLRGFVSTPTRSRVSAAP
ncbi:hypothetical protein [Mycobacteroides abscessus]|uniref:hypothetical protein n=1 Tax=Mycobacteroides abscessus TaxID=36809 RepID=UPI000C26BBC9|nr:hypothetical protein [Mycobacteroides abscessus]